MFRVAYQDDRVWLVEEVVSCTFERGDHATSGQSRVKG